MLIVPPLGIISFLHDLAAPSGRSVGAIARLSALVGAKLQLAQPVREQVHKRWQLGGVGGFQHGRRGRWAHWGGALHCLPFFVISFLSTHNQSCQC